MCRNYFPVLKEKYFQRHRKSHSDAVFQVFSWGGQHLNSCTLRASACKSLKLKRGLVTELSQIPQLKKCQSWSRQQWRLCESFHTNVNERTRCSRREKSWSITQSTFISAFKNGLATNNYTLSAWRYEKEHRCKMMTTWNGRGVARARLQAKACE